MSWVASISPEKWIAIFTGALFLVAALQFVAMTIQAHWTRKTVEVTKTAADASKIAADAATMSANTAEKTLNDLERPYVLIGDLTPWIRYNDYPIGDTGVPYNPRLKCTIKNYGRTPAIVKQIAAQLRLSKDRPPATLSVVPQKIIVLESGGSHTFDVPMGEELNKERAKLIQTTQISFWLHFHFVYRDIFSNPHETAGRWRYLFALDVFEPEGDDYYEGAT